MSSRWAELDAVVKDLNAPTNPNALPDTGMFVIAGNSDGELLYKGQSSSKMTEDTPTRVYSASKLVTPLILIAVLEDLQMTLDDPIPSSFVDKYPLMDQVLLEMPDDGRAPVFEKAQALVTFRQLCSHTSGISYLYDDNKAAKFAKQNLGYPENFSFKQKWVLGPLMFQPGTDFLYSPGLGTVGIILEHMTGKNLDELLKEKICQPLGLKNSTFLWEPDHREIYAYREERDVPGSPWKYRRLTNTAEGCYGDVSLITSAADYAAIMFEGFKAIQGKPNKLYKSTRLAQELFDTSQFNATAQQSLGEWIDANWLNYTWKSELKLTELSFGQGYLVNLVDLPSGRKAFSGCWEGYMGLRAVLSPADDAVLVMSAVLIHVDDIASRSAQDRVEQAFWKCLNKA